MGPFAQWLSRLLKTGPREAENLITKFPVKDAAAAEEAAWQMRVNRQYRLRFNVVRDAPSDVEEVWFGDPH